MGHIVCIRRCCISIFRALISRKICCCASYCYTSTKFQWAQNWYERGAKKSIASLKDWETSPRTRIFEWHIIFHSVAYSSDFSFRWPQKIKSVFFVRAHAYYTSSVYNNNNNKLIISNAHLMEEKESLNYSSPRELWCSLIKQYVDIFNGATRYEGSICWIQSRYGFLVPAHCLHACSTFCLWLMSK